MTRNHYEALARVLREEREFIQSLPSAQYPDSEVKTAALATLRTVANRLVSELEHLNPNFNRALFLLACGLED